MTLSLRNQLTREVQMESVINLLNGIIWSKALIYLCLGAGIYFSVRTRFLQIRHFKDMIKFLTSGGSSEQGVSSLQAFSISVAGRVGTGNIAGVATAIAMGGPGAVFWMMTIAFLGSGTSFIECALAQVYKEEIRGEYRGGPAYYIEKGMGNKLFASIFAVATLVGLGILMPGTQSNTIGAAINNSFGIAPGISVAVILVAVGAVIFGGTKRIGKVAEVVVPFMAMGYIIVALIVLVSNAAQIPSMLALIFKSAFGLEPIFGGILGLAVQWGVKRGVYSNEAGQGTGPQSAAAAEVSHPAVQGLVQAFAVYVDTLFICLATALMIMSTGMYNVYNPEGGFLVENLPGVDIGPGYAQAAASTVFGAYGSHFITIALFFFVFTTFLAYYYIAETNLEYLTRGKENDVFLKNGLRVVFLASSYYGALKTATIAWGLADIGVGIMAWMNIIAILIMGNIGLKVLKDYEDQKKMGRDQDSFIFEPDKLGIKNADLWNTINERRFKESKKVSNE